MLRHKLRFLRIILYPDIFRMTQAAAAVYHVSRGAIVTSAFIKRLTLL